MRGVSSKNGEEMKKDKITLTIEVNENKTLKTIANLKKNCEVTSYSVESIPSEKKMGF